MFISWPTAIAAQSTLASPHNWLSGYQHRTGGGSDFCIRYRLDRLVYAEAHDDIRGAIAREKAMKKWKREWKIKLIEEQNPDWVDLFAALNA